MKIAYFLVLFIAVCSLSVQAASFSLNGKTVSSMISENVVDCGKYQILIEHEHFPIEYENHIPKSFEISGFYGSRITVSKKAAILPKGFSIPLPSGITELKLLYPENRTYLPSDAVCKDNKVIISYWSGGNCSDCEAFVEFEYLNGIINNPQKVTYNELRALSK